MPATIRRTVFNMGRRPLFMTWITVAKELEGAPKRSHSRKSEVANMGHVVHRWPTCVKRDGPGWIPLPKRFSRSGQRIVQLQHQEFPEVWLAAGRGRTGVAGSPIKSIPPGSLPKAVERAANIDPFPI